MLEVVGVTGVVHLGQIQSGLRSAMRIAQVGSIFRKKNSIHRASEIFILNFTLQGGHIKIHLKSEVPVQVDGEPWLQPSGEVVVLKSALKVYSIIVCLSMI